MRWHGKHLDADSTWRYTAVTWAIAIAIATVTMTAALASHVFADAEYEREASAIVATDVETAPGCPLDAVRYEAPAWAGGMWCYRVMDRATEKTWWLVPMRDGDGTLRWHVMEVG